MTKIRSAPADEITRREWQEVFFPLVQHLLDLQARQARRIMVGIAGAPGSGKSTLATRLQRALTQIEGNATALVIGLDGWHVPNELLEEKNILVDGEWRSLITFKGVPESFDADAFLLFLRRARFVNNLRFPVYDRSLHQPIQDAGFLQSAHKILIVEGNYLLLEESPWNQIRTQLDLTCFLRVGESLRWQSLIQRHLRGGKSPAAALAHIRRVDVPNARRIGRPAADLLLERQRDGFHLLKNERE